MSNHAWIEYLSFRTMPNTGSKYFKVSEVWSCKMPNAPAFVYKVEKILPNEYVETKILAGGYEHRGPIAFSSWVAYFSARVTDTFSEFTVVPEDFFKRVFPSALNPLFAPPVRFEPLTPDPNLNKVNYTRVADSSGETWQTIVTRIMEKARKHYEAGRCNQFTQVLVPMEDFKILQDHFDCKEGIEISTCLGAIDVHPINPDRATFVD